MGTVELLALSLGLSIIVAALAWAGGVLVERLTADPGLRDRVWGAALLLPALPPAAMGLLLMTPAPVREITIAAATVPARTAQPTLDAAMIAGLLISAAAVLTLVRIVALTLRARRLKALIQSAEAPDAATLESVESAARRLTVATPRTAISAATPEALLTGLSRPLLVLPRDLIAQDAAIARAVILHELSHLKRGDHRALWVEELLLALLAANPLMPVLRDRRAAAREEACDALALADAGPETRRAYAQSLIEALRSRAGPHVTGALPVLTFTGAGRTTAMHRLKAVLNPAAPAGRRTRLTVAAAGLTLLAAAAGASVAMAAQREPETHLIPSAQQAGDTVREVQVFAHAAQSPAPQHEVQVRAHSVQNAPPPPPPAVERRRNGQAAAPRREVEIRAHGVQNAPPPPPAVERRRTGQAAAPRREVHIRAHGVGNTPPPPPPAVEQPPAPMHEVRIQAHGAQNQPPPPPPAIERPRPRPSPRP